MDSFLHFQPCPPSLHNNPNNKNLGCNFSSWAIFCRLTPLTARKMKIKKKKKMPGDILILHKCNRNHDHMLYCSLDMAHNRYNCYFSFWAIFLHFYLPKIPKNQNLEKVRKKKKNPRDINILQ